MAKTQQKDLFTQFKDLSSEALNRLTEMPGGSRLVDFANETRTRLDEMQKKLRGLDELEKRVTKLEQQLAAQTKKPAAARKPAAAKKPAPPPASPAEPS
jgi:DNA repair ATPase RecN